MLDDEVVHVESDEVDDEVIERDILEIGIIVMRHITDEVEVVDDIFVDEIDINEYL